jgi:digeranylgeranylglycerophospholipid reductase
MTVNPEYDVIIVGGGPSGIICAIALLKNGHKVALIDKKEQSLIGDKTCGDALDLESVNVLKEKLQLEYPYGIELSDDIHRMKIAGESIYTASTLTAPGFLVDRLEYGQRLLKNALDLGLILLSKSAVRDVIIEDNSVCGIIYIDKLSGKKISLRSKFVVDASGAYAVIRKLIPESLNYLNLIDNELSDEMVWPTYREIIELDSDQDHEFRNEIILLYERDIPIPGYFWIFSKGDRKLNIGVGWLKKETDMGSLKQFLKKKIDFYYPNRNYKVLKSGGGQIPIRPPFDNLVFNGGILVGDAACLVHPTTAEGHGPALESGYIAGTTISKALKQNRSDFESLWEYNVKVMNEIGILHAKGYLIRKLIENVGSKNLQFMINRQLIKDEEFDAIIRGQPPLLGFKDKLKKLIKIMPRIHLIIQIYKIQIKLNHVNDLYLNYPETPDQLPTWIETRNRLLGFNF